MLQVGIVRRLGAVVLLAAVSGCGETVSDVPELAEVQGRVTMAGQAVQEATIVFEPQQGALSTGITDADGRFELYYSKDHKGAVPGRHTIKISKLDGEAGDETIPSQYNEDSQITEEVTQAGPNDFTFELK